MVVYDRINVYMYMKGFRNALKRYLKRFYEIVQYSLVKAARGGLAGKRPKVLRGDFHILLSISVILEME